MPEAAFIRKSQRYNLLPAATVDGGQVFQLPTGEAAYLNAADPAGTSEYTDDVWTADKAILAKATGVALLAGQEAQCDGAFPPVFLGSIRRGAM